MDTPIDLEVTDGVARVTLNRPDVRNAFDGAMLRGLTTTFEELARDDTVQVVIVTGAGSAFSAGADLDWMSAMVDHGFEENVEDARTFERMLRAIDESPQCVVAQVNGHAMAGACGIIACADIAVASRDAKFGFSEARLGLAPAMIAAYVQRRIGAHARRYFLTAETFDATTAHRIGLVSEICAGDALPARVDEIVAALLAGDGLAQREIKSLVRKIEHDSDPAATEDGRVELIARLRVGESAQARMRAFLDARRRSSTA